MCGLIGYSGKTECDQRTIELLIAWNALKRGEDATGIYSPVNGVRKTLMSGDHYISYVVKDYFVPDDVLIAHVRQATIGAKDNIDNAHPFKRGNFILAHNGTLKNHRDLLFKYGRNTDTTFNVDSDCVAGSMEACDDIATVLSEINGAGAFLIYDERKEGDLYIFRNKERPLWRGYDEDGGMYISSIPEPLYFSGLDKIKEFKEDMLYCVNGGVFSSNKAKTKKITNTPYSKPTTHYHHRDFEWDDEETLNAVCGYYPNKNRQTVPNPMVPLLPVVTDGDQQTKKPNTKKYDIFENLWLRAKVSINYYDTYFGQRVQLDQGKYYFIASDSNNNKRLWMQNGDDYIEVDKSMFMMSDVITAKDLICLLEDNVEDPTNQKKIGNTGDVFEVSMIYADSDVLLYKHGVGHPTPRVGYCRKRQVRKLTANEKEQYISEYNNVLREKEETINQNIIDFPTAEDMGDDNNQIIVNEKGIVTFFEKLDDMLEEARDYAHKNPNDSENIKLRMTKIIDYQFSEREKLINNGINV